MSTRTKQLERIAFIHRGLGFLYGMIAGFTCGWVGRVILSLLQ